MSLFIGTLAFGQSDLERAMRLGVLVGSALSAIVGVGVLAAARPLRRTTGRPEVPGEEEAPPQSRGLRDWPPR